LHNFVSNPHLGGGTMAIASSSEKAKNEGHRRIFSGDVEFRVQGMRGNPLGQQCYSDVTPVRNCTIRAFDAGFSPNSGVWGLKR
jgi:hypothetical protein